MAGLKAMPHDLCMCAVCMIINSTQSLHTTVSNAPSRLPFWGLMHFAKFDGDRANIPIMCIGKEVHHSFIAPCCFEIGRIVNGVHCRICPHMKITNYRGDWSGGYEFARLEDAIAGINRFLLIEALTTCPPHCTPGICWFGLNTIPPQIIETDGSDYMIVAMDI